MAAGWIKIRTDLDKDPAVIQLSEEFGWQEHVIVGLLHKLWSWADGQLRSGYARGVTETFIDRYLGVAGFAQALERAGWLVIHTTPEKGIEFPNWDNHMSQSAKSRALSQKRMSRKRYADSVTSASPEKRREEKEKNVIQEQNNINPKVTSIGTEPPLANASAGVDVNLPVNGCSFKVLDGSLWKPPPALLATLRETYPTVDIQRHLREAAAWCETNPAKRPPAANMPGWLNNYLARRVPAPPEATPRAPNLAKMLRERRKANDA